MSSRPSSTADRRALMESLRKQKGKADETGRKRKRTPKPEFPPHLEQVSTSVQVLPPPPQPTRNAQEVTLVDDTTGGLSEDPQRRSPNYCGITLKRLGDVMPQDDFFMNICGEDFQSLCNTAFRAAATASAILHMVHSSGMKDIHKEKEMHKKTFLKKLDADKKFDAKNIELDQAKESFSQA